MSVEDPNRATHYHVQQLDFPDKGCAIKGLLLWLGSKKRMGYRTCKSCCDQDGYQAQVPQHPIEI